MADGDLLVVEDLVVEFLGDEGPLRAVDGVSFSLRPGEIFGLCGESGSGKSTLALALARLLPPPAVITAGRVWLRGQDVFALDAAGLRQLRGGQLAVVPQSGMNALHPLLTIADQIVDGIVAHAGPEDRSRRKLAVERAAELLALVGLDPAVGRAFPHQLSGGMRQRAAIAIALGPAPSLLVMDEATGGLDVLLERQLCDRLQDLARRLGLAILFISHDLPATLALAARAGVLYGGRLVETGPAAALRDDPQHPYTRALLACFLDPRRRQGAEVAGIAGAPPDPRQLPSGCAFHPRCLLAFERCSRERPLLLPRLAKNESGAPQRRQNACHLGGGS
jgi:peptide/nickel transport system ATP-binding protein